MLKRPGEGAERDSKYCLEAEMGWVGLTEAA